MKAYDHYTNPLLDFIEEKDDLLFDEEGNGREVARTTLYAEFKEWMSNNGEDKFAFSARRFYHYMENTFKAAGSYLIKYQEHGLGWMFRAEARIA